MEVLLGTTDGLSHWKRLVATGATGSHSAVWLCGLGKTDQHQDLPTSEFRQVLIIASSPFLLNQFISLHSLVLLTRILGHAFLQTTASRAGKRSLDFSSHHTAPPF